MFQRFTHRQRQYYSGLVETPDGAIHVVRQDEVKTLAKQIYHDFLHTAAFGAPEDVQTMLEKKHQDIQRQYGRHSLQMGVFMAAYEEAGEKIEAQAKAFLLPVARAYVAVGEVLLKVATA